MPKIPSFPTRLPENVTGDEYVAVTDTGDSTTYRINVQNWIESLSQTSGYSGTLEVTTPTGTATITFVNGIVTSVIEV